ncbi:MAG: leucine-rich repeat domain-containing protein [Verrucomicrobiae bacterium]|nr:leucine-rich repeat domain-containing protein [Verrucomicrobiae bacterium]
MKSKILIPLLTLACLLAMPARAQVNYEIYGSVAYVAISPNASGNVVIASSYNGYPVVSIGDLAFFECTSLTSVTIPNSVTSIGAWAFFSCTNLTSVMIPNSVTSIGPRAFSSTSQTSVMIPASVTNIGSLAFFSVGLTNISVDAANAVYSSLDGVLFNKAQTTLIQFPNGRGGSYAIPNTVTNIGAYAFQGCSSLTSVVIPGSVTKYNVISNCIYQIPQRRRRVALGRDQRRNVGSTAAMTSSRAAK